MLSKTPIAISLRDENALEKIGGKLGKTNGNENLATHKKRNATFEKNAFVTPMGPRSRAPLGIKTTNAKINALRTPVESQLQEVSKTNKLKSIHTRQPTKAVYADKAKPELSASEASISEPDVEYCPPTPKSLPYESETFPRDCLNYSHIQSQNIMRDLYKKNKILQLDERGLSKHEKEQEEAYQRDARIADEKVLTMMKEEWTIAGVSEISSDEQESNSCSQLDKHVMTETKKLTVPRRGITTLTSKKACHALSVAPKPVISQTKISRLPCKPIVALSRSKPPPTKKISSHNAARFNATSNATSRSTIGYSKGRDIPNILQQLTQREQTNAKQISVSKTKPGNTSNFKRFSTNRKCSDPNFLKMFDKEEELEPELCGIISESAKKGEEDEFFVMTLS